MHGNDCIPNRVLEFPALILTGIMEMLAKKAGMMDRQRENVPLAGIAEKCPG